MQEEFKIAEIVKGERVRMLLSVDKHLVMKNILRFDSHASSPAWQ